jgi:hypothetical protein
MLCQTVRDALRAQQNKTQVCCNATDSSDWRHTQQTSHISMRATKTTHDSTHDAQHIATHRLAGTCTTTGLAQQVIGGYTGELAALTCVQQTYPSKTHVAQKEGQAQKGYRAHLVKTPQQPHMYAYIHHTRHTKPGRQPEIC